MKKIDKSKANRLFTEPEIEVHYLMGRFKRLVCPPRTIEDPGASIDYHKANFTEIQSLALEQMHDKLEIEINQLCDYIAELEINAGLANYAGDD